MWGSNNINYLIANKLKSSNIFHPPWFSFCCAMHKTRSGVPIKRFRFREMTLRLWAPIEWIWQCGCWFTIDYVCTSTSEVRFSLMWVMSMATRMMSLARGPISTDVSVVELHHRWVQLGMKSQLLLFSTGYVNSKLTFQRQTQLRYMSEK